MLCTGLAASLLGQEWDPWGQVRVYQVVYYSTYNRIVSIIEGDSRSRLKRGLVESVQVTLRPHHVARVTRGEVQLYRKEPKGLDGQKRESSRPGRRK